MRATWKYCPNVKCLCLLLVALQRDEGKVGGFIIIIINNNQHNAIVNLRQLNQGRLSQYFSPLYIICIQGF